MPRSHYAALAATGAVLFEVNACVICHGTAGAAVSGPVPNLNRTPPADLAMFRTVLKEGALARNGMPRFEYLSDAELRSLFAYVINEAWAAYDRDQEADQRAAQSAH